MWFRGALIVAVGLLAGCEGDIPNPFGPVSDTMSVAGGNVLIAGPAGYCPDRGASSLGGSQPVVVLGSCASVRNNPSASAPQIPGILTASVSPVNGANLDGASTRLRAFFRSVEGRSALARDGNANSVRVLSTRRVQGAFVLQIEDRSANRIEGLSDRYWRAIFDLNGRLFTLSVIAFDTKPMSDRYAVDTLIGFVQRVRQKNSVGTGDG